MENLSVIIPAFNAGKTIESTLQSILKQTVQPREIIVIDDGSTDNTGDVVRKYPHVIYVRQTNSGVSSARNHGVELSNSPWIAFCDADDVWHPSKISICQRVIREFPGIPFVFHNFYIFNDSKVITESRISASPPFFAIFLENRISMEDILRRRRTLDLCRREYQDKTTVDILSGNAFEGLILGNFILPSTVMIRKDIFLEMGRFDPTFPVAEDMEFFLRASKMIDFLYIDLPLAGYRRASGGLTSNLSRLITHGLRAFEKHCLEDPMARARFPKNLNIGAAKRYARMSYYYLSECQRSAASKYAIDSLRYNPFERRAWLSLMLSIFPVLVLKRMRSAKAWCTKKTFS